MKGCSICLVSKIVCHKFYGDLQLLPVLTHCWKDLLIDFVTSLPLSANWKDDNYNSIFVIINRLTKMIYYKPVKVPIKALGLAKIIINIIMQYYGLWDSIISNHKVIFMSKFWFLLYYFLGIKRKLFTAFYP